MENISKKIKAQGVLPCFVGGAHVVLALPCTSSAASSTCPCHTVFWPREQARMHVLTRVALCV